MLIYGYTGKFLRANLSTGKLTAQDRDADFLSKYLGGAGFGARYLYDENPDNCDWSDPENRIILSNGPLSDKRANDQSGRIQPG